MAIIDKETSTGIYKGRCENCNKEFKVFLFLGKDKDLYVPTKLDCLCAVCKTPVIARSQTKPV